MQEEKKTAAGLCVCQRTQLLRLKEYSNPYRRPDLLIVSSHMSAVPEVDVQTEYGQVSVCSLWAKSSGFELLEALCFYHFYGYNRYLWCNRDRIFLI